MKTKKEPLVEVCLSMGVSLALPNGCEVVETWISDEDAFRLYAELRDLMPKLHERYGTEPKPKRITAAQRKAIRKLPVWDGFRPEDIGGDDVDEIADAVAGILLK